MTIWQPPIAQLPLRSYNLPNSMFPLAQEAYMKKRSYTVETRYIPQSPRPPKVLIARPAHLGEAGVRPPAILWLHGGGYATGMAGMLYMSRALPLVKKYGAVVVVPEYRLAGRDPYPAGLADCYAALLYMRDHCEEWGCDSSQLMVGGESAGGGLTAALCMLARDRGQVKIAYQMPLYPMLDDRDTESSRANPGISWGTGRNHAAWRLYLRRLRGRRIPAYAVPARQTDYTGLPPAYTFVGDREPFYCETLTYVEELRRAGVPAQVDVYPTGFHAFDMLMPWRRISRQAAERFEQAYRQAVEQYHAPQEES